MSPYPTRRPSSAAEESHADDHHHQFDPDPPPPTATSPSIPAQWTRRRVLILASCSLLQLPIWGFAMTYGIFQEHYQSHPTFSGSVSAAGSIGTTSNGVMYLSMPFLFSLVSRRWSAYRRHACVAGIILTAASFVLSSFSTAVWHLVATQGVLAALGCALVYSPTTLSMSDNFTPTNRALAYGIVLSCKNIVGTTCPFLLSSLLGHFGAATTIRIWAGITLLTSGPCLFMPLHPPGQVDPATGSRRIPWAFLAYPTVWINLVATLLQSSGYGIPQTYLTSYARSAALSTSSATLLVTLFNAPGILSSACFAFLMDNKRLRMSSTTVSCLSASVSALAVFLLWGFGTASNHALALLATFALVYGFFAGGSSAAWGGVIKEMEDEGAERNEAVDGGVLLGLLNGARGFGYVGGGLAGVKLLQAGRGADMGPWGYGTEFGPLILYTGLSTICGGIGVFWRMGRLLR